MDEVHVIGHIFGQLENQDNAIRHIFKSIKRMQKIDKRMGVMTGIVFGCLYIMDRKVRETNHKIDILYRKIKKLEEKDQEE